MVHLTPRAWWLAGAATIVLAAGSTVGLGAALGGFGSTAAPAPTGSVGSSGRTASCAVPSLPGSVVQVTLSDAAGRIGDGFGGQANVPGQSSASTADDTATRLSITRVQLSPARVGAGQVSLSVHNEATGSHRVLVIPLTQPTPNGSGTTPGLPGFGPDGMGMNGFGLGNLADLANPVGEASATCAPGSGTGISAGQAGWTTMTLTAGRYAVVSPVGPQLPFGLFAILTVTA